MKQYFKKMMSDGEDLGNGGGDQLAESNDAPPVDPVLAATNDLPADEAKAGPSDEAAEVPATVDSAEAVEA